MIFVTIYVNIVIITKKLYFQSVCDAEFQIFSLQTCTPPNIDCFSGFIIETTTGPTSIPVISQLFMLITVEDVDRKPDGYFKCASPNKDLPIIIDNGNFSSVQFTCSFRRLCLSSRFRLRIESST